MKKITLAANWKMYLSELNSVAFTKKMNKHKEVLSDKDIILFPSPACIRSVKDTLALDNIHVGMQDCDINVDSAVTGGVSITSIDVDYCIVGHSETRNKTLIKPVSMVNDNQLMGLKLNNVLVLAGIRGIYCVGETKEERNNGLTESVINDQLSIFKRGETKTYIDNEELGLSNNLIIAYEPVWSIGSGMLPSNDEIYNILSLIKNKLNDYCPSANVRLFYGGSVNKDNVDKLLEIDLIDGFLVGSASANFDSFIEIVKRIK